MCFYDSGTLLHGKFVSKFITRGLSVESKPPLPPLQWILLCVAKCSLLLVLAVVKWKWKWSHHYWKLCSLLSWCLFWPNGKFAIFLGYLTTFHITSEITLSWVSCSVVSYLLISQTSWKLTRKILRNVINTLSLTKVLSVKMHATCICWQ